jgi:hypothetical protein
MQTPDPGNPAHSNRSISALPLFPDIGTKVNLAGFLPEGNWRLEDMGAAHQIANASVAAIFSIALLVTAQLFIEYRSARGPAVIYAERPVVPL